MKVNLFFVVGVLFSGFAAAQTQTASRGSQSTVYLSPAHLEKTREYGNGPSSIESRVLAGAGFMYTYNFSEHFAYESQFEIAGGRNVLLCTFTGNIVCSYSPGEGRPTVFLEGGYGLGIPSIFTSEVVRLDVGTIHLASGIKLPIGDDELLRIGIDYKRFRIYNNASGDNSTTFRSIGLHIGYGIVSHEPGDGR